MAVLEMEEVEAAVESVCDDDGCGCHNDGHEHGDGCGCHDDEHAHEHGEGCGCHDDGCHDDDCHDSHLAALDEAPALANPSLSYHVLGIDCPHCALGVQNAVAALPCVEAARLTYATATLDVELEPGADRFDARRQILATVRSSGQDLELSEAEREELEAARPWFEEHREQVLMGISGAALALGLILEHLAGNEDAAIPAYIVAAVAGLVFVAPMALAALRRRTADMNVLMGIAVLGALIMGLAGDRSVFADAAIVIFLDQVGEWLEGWSMRRTSGSIAELMELAPDTAHVVGADGSVEERAVSSIEEGERIRILPGERVPLDGTILSGASSFNEAAITGESVPADKAAGDAVFAGTLNIQGAVELEVTADEDCTALARVISQVQGAQAAKAPYEGFIDRFAAAYTPIVIVGALVIGLGVPTVLTLAGNAPAGLWHDWIYRALSLLVVACPCALVISTPVSFVSALSRAARMGVLVKGGAYFDIGSKVDTVALDKTGTLTAGAPGVTGVAALEGASEEGVLALAAALEQHSTHPLARAITARAAELGLELPGAEGIEETAASGVTASVEDAPAAVGKPAYVASLAGGELPADAAAAAARFEDAGATALAVSWNGRVVGVVGVADTLRASTPAAIAELTAAARPLEVEMLTGDAEAAAAAIALQAGVTRYSAGLMPADKLERIRSLQAGGRTVAMVGDGINDAPALAAADLGITMGAAASDTALEVADVALLADDLIALPGFFRLAERTMHVVRENIAIAIGVKALVFVAVVLGAAGMGAAVFADTGVALLVILNGMRLMSPAETRW